MDREVAKHTRESRRKGKKKKGRKALIVLTTTERLAKRELVKQHGTNFITTWSSSTIRKVGDKFHYNYNYKFGILKSP
jgi:hypothetical protein